MVSKDFQGDDLWPHYVASWPLSVCSGYFVIYPDSSLELTRISGEALIPVFGDQDATVSRFLSHKSTFRR